MHQRTTAVVAAVTVLILATGVVLASHQYPDVPDSNKYHNDIDWLTTNGIAFGYANGNFGPGRRPDPGSASSVPPSIQHQVQPPQRLSTPSSRCSWTVATVLPDGPSTPRRSARPAGTTVSGDFRFSCSARPGALQDLVRGGGDLGNQTGDAAVHPRLLIHKDAPTTAEKAIIVICENVDGANNNAGLATIPRVPTLQDAVTEMQTPLGMGVGGSLDCDSTQPYGTGDPEGDLGAIGIRDRYRLLRRGGNLRIRPDPRPAAG